MAATRDLYALLGVTRDATDADIRTAYRRLARELHPDVNGDPAAETRFKEIAGAYEILSDPEKRARYDAYGDGGGQPFADIGDIFEMFFGQGGFGGFGSRRRGPRTRTRRGEDVGVHVQLSFEEAAFGVRQDVELERLAVCERCMGNGAEPGLGADRVPDVRRDRRGAERAAERLRHVDDDRAVRDLPGDRGRRSPIRARTCAGEGRVRRRGFGDGRDPRRRRRWHGTARRRERTRRRRRRVGRRPVRSARGRRVATRSNGEGSTCTPCSTSRSRRRRSAPTSGSRGSTAPRS